MPAASGEMCEFLLGNENGAGLILQAPEIRQGTTNGRVGGQVMLQHASYSNEDGNRKRANLVPHTL